MQSRSFQPTARRLREARRSGFVPFSEQLCRAAGVVGACAAAVVAAERLVEGCRAFWQRVLAPAATLTPQLGSDAVRLLLDASAPILYVAFVAAWVTGLLQTGGALRRPGRAPAGVPPRLEPTSIVRSTSTAAFACAASIGAALLSLNHLPDAANSMLQHQAALELIGALALRVLYACAAGCVLAALVDWTLARRQWLAALRMTASERRMESRTEYGAPEVRAARRLARSEIPDARRRSA